jgi:hypothetical protein
MPVSDHLRIVSVYPSSCGVMMVDEVREERRAESAEAGMDMLILFSLYLGISLVV